MVVYFIQRSYDNAIKIGYSGCMKHRWSLLRCTAESELTILAIIDGKKEVESRLHDKFADHRIKGEWFYPCEELIKYIAMLGDNVLSLEQACAAPDDLIQIKIKRSDYDRLVKFGVAGEPVHEAATRALDKAETLQAKYDKLLAAKLEMEEMYNPSDL